MAPVYSFALTIDTVDVASLSLLVAALPKNWSTPSISFSEVSLPEVAGVVVTTNVPKVDAIDYQISGNISCASPSDLETAVDALKYASYSKLGVSLTPGNQPTRYRTGCLQDMDIQPYPSMAQAKFEAVLRCRDPLWYATTDTTVSGSGDLSCPQGTWAASPVITMGAGTLQYKNSAGTAIGDPLVLAGSGTMTVDFGLRTIAVSGTRHDEYLSSGDFFALDPRDGGATKTPKVNASVSASIVYKQRFL